MDSFSKDSKVGIGAIHEFVEAEQHDPFVPIDWIYDKDWNLDDVLEYVRNYNDKLRMVDETEDEEFWI